MLKQLYFIQNTKCYLQCRSVKADGFPLKDQIWLMCRAAWDPPSVGKPLRPGKLPQVEEDGWGQRCFFTFALSGNSLHPDSKLRVIHAQGILMFCSFLENLSVLDTAEELLFIKKKNSDIIILLQWQYYNNFSPKWELVVFWGPAGAKKIYLSRQNQNIF